MGAFVEMESMSSASQINNKSSDGESNNSKQTRENLSMFQATTHLFKGSVGAGLFAMGDCYKNGGIIGATVLVPLMAIIVVHCEQLLIENSVMAVEKTLGASYFDYPETIQKCFEYGSKRCRRFSKPMKLIAETFICVTQFGLCGIFFAFMIKNIHQVVQEYGIDLSQNTVAVFTLIPAMIPSLMTTLKLIAPVSFLGSLSLMFGVSSTLGLALSEGPLPSISERNLITPITQLSLCFGTALLAFEGIALILPLRNSMKKPEKFVSRFGVLNVSFFFITILFIFTGLICYLRWGEDVKGSISLNLDSSNVFAQVVKIIAASGVFFGYPLQFMLLIKIIWAPTAQSPSFIQKHPITLEVLLRFIMVLLTFRLALAVPNLGVFISLIGAFCATTLALIIPVTIDLVSKAQIPGALTFYVYAKNIAILVISVLGIFVGTYQSVIEIIAAFKN